jgi:DNA gyrase/topoisomerase IV subunit B
MTRKYDESDITGFTRDLEKIQAKPTLFIGPLDNAGVFTLLRECMDNAVDEARAGRNEFIHVYVHGLNGPFTVVDGGVGIPVKMHEKMKISTLTHVLTNLQSSGKMKVGGAYKSAVGTHGVGIKATNALSSEFDVWTYRKDAGGWHHTKFKKGHEKSPVKKAKAPQVTIPGRKKVVSYPSGTCVTFTPDEAVFKKHKLDIKALVQWAKMTAYMNAKLKIKVFFEGKEKTFYSKDGIKSYLAARIEATKATPFSKKQIGYASGTLEMALAFTDLEGSNVEFFTNTVRNVEEGVHADDVYKALFDSLKPHKGKNEFTPTDLRDGLLGIVNYKIDAPQFDSQTKEKLVDARVKGACYKEAMDVFGAFWKENKGLAKDLCTRAALLRSKTSEFLMGKKLIKNVNAAKKLVNTKLAPIQGKAPIEERELFLVEGDSAGGGAKRARDKTRQAIYPLRGKPLNVMEAKQEKINNNNEIVGLLAALGIDLGGKKPNLEVPYGKIISMADPDVDGDHINVLLLGALHKYLPNLFKQGKVFVVKAPLYKSRYKGVVYFGMSKDEVYKKTGTPNCEVTYIKGWGELSESDLGVALDPKARKLYKVLAPDKAGTNQFRLLLGKAPAFRKELFGVN